MRKISATSSRCCFIPSAEGGGTTSSEFQGTDGRAYVHVGDLEIAGGGFEIGMSEQDLNGAEIHSGFQQVSGKGVPQRMRMNRLGNAGVLPGFLAGAEDRLSREI